MSKNKGRAGFSSSLGFILAAAGSAVGLGNIWRFPYLAARDGGGFFLLVYLLLVATFGFTMLTSEIALGRRTGKGPLVAYGIAHPKFKFLGVLASAIPALILPYYCVIGGWVIKYSVEFITMDGAAAAADGYFTSFTSQVGEPIFCMLVFLFLTALAITLGVQRGIEKISKVAMPILLVLIIGIACYSLSTSYTDASGVTRTGLEGLKIYLVPDFKNMTIVDMMDTVMDAMGQLFYSVSVAMGIMVAFGSYCPKEENLTSSINKIEIFDTIVSFFAGLMIVPTVYTFMGQEGMSAGPGLMFITLPKVFNEMGFSGSFVGMIFFLTVFFAAITSSISIMEAIISGMIDRWGLERRRCVGITLIYLMIMGILVCLGYNKFYFELRLPNGTVGQLLDLLDYISNLIMMPILAIGTCILIGWVVGPKYIIDEMELDGAKFGRKWLYVPMIKFVAPALLVILFIQSFVV